MAPAQPETERPAAGTGGSRIANVRPGPRKEGGRLGPAEPSAADSGARARPDRGRDAPGWVTGSESVGDSDTPET